MHNMLRWLLVPSLLIAAAGCPDVDVDQDEVGTGGPVVEFNPAAKIIPFPNNLLLDPTTGKVSIPASCNESPTAKGLREGVLNKLDGFGTYEVTMYAQFSTAIDMASFTSKVVLYKRAAAGMAVDPANSAEIPLLMIPSMGIRYDADCANPSMVPQLNFVPTRPLDQKSTYDVAILSGVNTSAGEPFGPSFTWSLIRNETNPVTIAADGSVTANNTPIDQTSAEGLAQIQGINLLWKAHAQALAFLASKGHDRKDILLAWEFNTQTVTDPLDPSVAGSVAAELGGTIVGLNRISCAKNATTCPNGIDRTMPPYVLCGSDTDTQCFLKIALGSIAGDNTASIYTTGNAVCGQVGCTNIGDVYAGAVLAKQFQTDRMNSFNPAAPIPGPWADPVKPAVVKMEPIQFLAFIPAGTKPATGYPSVIFGHGLGSTKKSAFAIAPQLATPRAFPGLGTSGGFITIAIDFVAHDSRAVRISDQGVCAGTPAATSLPQCFAPFLSPDLGNTRDNIRQSVLDLESLRNAIKTCGLAGCTQNDAFGGFSFDDAHVSYAGISLGGIMGSTFGAVRDDVKTRALSVPGVGWVDILENTDNLSIRCSLVDGLIAAGILTGDPSSAGATALCLTPAWKAQPGYQQFASIGRWVLDSGDPANFTPKLATKRLLIQKVDMDQVVPNIATDREIALVGLTESAAACVPAAGLVGPTPVLLMNLTASKALKYTNLTGTLMCPDATGTNQQSPGATYEHASLLAPARGHCTVATTTRCTVNAQCTGAGDTCDAASVGAGQLGTVRLQTDLITFLHLNK